MSLIARLLRRIALANPTDLLLLAAVTVFAVAILAMPASWASDLGPHPDAEEYARTARNLAAGSGFHIKLFGENYPSRYTFGFPLLLTPVYWLLGMNLSNGVYVVILCSILTVAFVFVLAHRMLGRVAAVASALIVIGLPRTLDWSRVIMSESAVMALAAASLLILHLAFSAKRYRSQIWWMLGLGAVTGFSLTITLARLVALPVIAMVTIQGVSGWRRRLTLYLAFLCGPIVALTALAAYSLVTFGSITNNGYKYWVPYWYATWDRTFSIGYAIQGISQDNQGPNWLYYFTILIGTHTDHGKLFLSMGFLLLALSGIVVLVIDGPPTTRLVVNYGLLSAGMVLLFFVPYFYQSARFLAPIVPFVAICAGSAVTAGIKWLIVGFRGRDSPAIVAGGFVVLVALWEIYGSFIPLVRQSYIYATYVEKRPARYAWNSEIASIYSRLSPDGAIILTSIPESFAEESGITKRATVIPIARHNYALLPPLSHVKTLSESQARVDAALEASSIVLTDNLSIVSLERNEFLYGSALAALRKYELQTFAREGPAVIYRLVRKQEQD